MVLKAFCRQKGRLKPAEPNYNYSYSGNQYFPAALKKILHTASPKHCAQDASGLGAITGFVTMAATVIIHQVVFFSLTKYLVFHIIYMHFMFNLCTEFTVSGMSYVNFVSCAVFFSYFYF